MQFISTFGGYSYQVVCDQCHKQDIPRNFDYELLVRGLPYNFYVVDESRFLCADCLVQNLPQVQSHYRPFFKLPQRALPQGAPNDNALATLLTLRTLAPFNFEATWKKWYYSPHSVKEDPYNQQDLLIYNDLERYGVMTNDYIRMFHYRTELARCGPQFIFTGNEIPAGSFCRDLAMLPPPFTPSEIINQFTWLPENIKDPHSPSMRNPRVNRVPKNKKICAITTPGNYPIPAVIRGSLRNYGQEYRVVLPAMVELDADEPFHVCTFSWAGRLTCHLSAYLPPDAE